MSSKNYFPTMKIPEIIQCLDALNIRISETDLLKPQPNTAFRLFEALADQLMNIQYGKYPGNLGQEGNMQRILEDTTDNPELHQDSLSLMIFFRQMSHVMLNIGVKDFCLKDIISPEPGRIRMLLSAIINFARFREERLALFEELTAQMDELMNIRNQLFEMNANMTDELNGLRLQRTAEQPELEKMMEKNKELTEQLKTMKSSGDFSSQSIQKLKDEKSEIQEKLQNLTFLANHNKQDIQRLRSRIVRNPEQLKKSILDMNVSLNSTKQNISNSEKVARDIQVKMDNLKILESDLQLCLNLLIECELEQKKLDEVKNVHFNGKQMLDRKRTEQTEMTLTEQQIKRQVSIAEDKLTRLNQQLTVKRTNLESKLTKYRSEWELLDQEEKEIQKSLDTYQNEIMIVKQKIQEIKKAHDKEMSDIVVEYSALKDSLSNFTMDVKREILGVEIM